MWPGIIGSKYAVLGILVFFGGQEAAIDWLDGLRSPVWRERYDTVTRLRSLPDEARRLVLRDTRVQQSVSSLLQAENEETATWYVDGRGVVGVYGEQYGEYYSELFTLALETVDLVEDHGLKLNLLAHLANGSYNPDSAVVFQLAVYGDLIVNTAVNLTSSTLPANRWHGYALLGAMLGLAERVWLSCWTNPTKSRTTGCGIRA